MNNISSWSIKNPVPTLVLFLTLTVAGLMAFGQLGIDENPNIDIPIVSVIVTQVGAAPSELETEVTRKVEDAVAGIGNIKHILSTVNEGSSLTTIEFELGTSIDRATNDVRDAISRIRQQLPQSIDEPVIQRLDFVGGPFVTYTIESKGRSVAELSWLVDNDISRALMSVPGVGQVQRSGGVDREIRVNLDPFRLDALGITADTVNTQVRNLNANLPGGRGDIGSSEQSIRTLGSALNIKDLQGTQIGLPSGRYARLDTLGEITDGASEPRQLALLDGKSVVAFSVVRSTGSNLVDVEQGVDKKLQTLKKILPADIKINKIRSNSKYVKESYHASFDSLVVGAVLAVIVIWWFLREWRAALIAGLAMPLSVIPTFVVMKWCGYTLNNMSLLGLALVIGILVDDAIVEIENIVRHIRMGKPPYQAAMEAADEIGLAVVATSMTIVVVFVPVAFMGGIPGQFFRQFGITVAVAVLFSLLVARMITPLMAAHMLQKLPEDESKSKLMLMYESLLQFAMKKRLTTVIIAVVFFATSLMLFRMLPTSLVSKADRGETILTFELPAGSSLDDSRQAAIKLTRIVLDRPETESVFASVGTATTRSRGSAGSTGEVNKGNLYITLKDKDKRSLSQDDFEDKVRERFKEVPGVRASFTTAQGISGRLRVLLTSNNTEALTKSAEKLTDEIRSIPGLSDVVSSASLLRPEILVKPDFARAADQGVSVQAIARTARIATLGDIDANLAKFNLPDRQINIRVEIDPRYREDFEIMGNMKVLGNDGRMVPLSNVATISMGSGPATLQRYDRAQQVTIEASMAPSVTLGQVLQQVHNLPAYKSLPAEVKEQPAGDAEIQRDVFAGFGGAITYAIMLIYVVLVLLFGGFLHPLTIMVSLPLSLGGALMGLLVFGKSLGLYALIGIVMLMGLVTKNAILLVEYCLLMMHQGVPRDEAIIKAGHTRMKPIMMTTVAMIAGMIPISMGFGAGSEVRSPMALAVIGGLVSSTLLTLVVVPVVFTYIDDFQQWLITKFNSRHGRDNLSDYSPNTSLDAPATTDKVQS